VGALFETLSSGGSSFGVNGEAGLVASCFTFAAGEAGLGSREAQAKSAVALQKMMKWHLVRLTLVTEQTYGKAANQAKERCPHPHIYANPLRHLRPCSS
jgi:hypothetical protein